MKNIDQLFLDQKRFFYKHLIKENLENQIQKLKLIRKLIKKNEKKIINHILKDYKKPITEIYTTEFKPVKKWIAYHGFSININNDISNYNKIIPCGIKNKGITTLKKIKNQSYKNFPDELIKNLIFNLKI